MTTYFVNLIIKLHILYILTTNFMIFTIVRSIDLYLCIILNYKNLKFKYLIHDIMLGWIGLGCWVEITPTDK